jgi:hypothetical protein
VNEYTVRLLNLHPIIYKPMGGVEISNMEIKAILTKRIGNFGFLK